MKRVVAIRLIGDEQALRLAAELLDALLGERVELGVARKGRKGTRTDYLAYGTLVVSTDARPTAPRRKGEDHA
jgi:hypothetical protein